MDRQGIANGFLLYFFSISAYIPFDKPSMDMCFRCIITTNIIKIATALTQILPLPSDIGMYFATLIND